MASVPLSRQCGGTRSLKSRGERRRRRQHIANKNTGIVCGERRAGQIGSGERDGDCRAPVAAVRRKSCDRRRPYATRDACGGQQIPNGIVAIRRDIPPLPVVHLGEAPKGHRRYSSPGRQRPDSESLCSQAEKPPITKPSLHYS